MRWAWPSLKSHGSSRRQAVVVILLGSQVVYQYDQYPRGQSKASTGCRQSRRVQMTTRYRDASPPTVTHAQRRPCSRRSSDVSLPHTQLHTGRPPFTVLVGHLVSVRGHLDQDGHPHRLAGHARRCCAVNLALARCCCAGCSRRCGRAGAFFRFWAWEAVTEEAKAGARTRAAPHVRGGGRPRGLGVVWHRFWEERVEREGLEKTKC